jgi:hypothetical protein
MSVPRRKTRHELTLAFRTDASRHEPQNPSVDAQHGAGLAELVSPDDIF